MNLPDVIDKLIDNANLGKLVTDVGAGFALALPFLMLIGLSTGISVVPADRLVDLRDRLARGEARLEQYKRAFCKESAAADPDRCYLDGQRRLASIHGELDSMKVRADALVRQGQPIPAALETERRPLQAQADELFVQQQLVEEAAAALAELRNDERDASSFEYNVAALTNNLTAMLVFSVVLGVILSQVCRVVFINGIYDRWFVRPAPPTPARTVLKPGYDELRTNYLRYVEGSINMVPAVLLFGFVFPSYAITKLGIADISRGLWGAAAIAIAAALVVAGGLTYRSYSKKVEDLRHDVEEMPEEFRV